MSGKSSGCSWCAKWRDGSRPVKSEAWLGRVQGAADTAADLLERASLAQALDEAVARLRPEYREAVVLRYHEELSYDDIAEVMSIPVGTAKTYVHRARKELADELEAAGWGSAP